MVAMAVVFLGADGPCGADRPLRDEPRLLLRVHYPANMPRGVHRTQVGEALEEVQIGSHRRVIRRKGHNDGAATSDRFYAAIPHRLFLFSLHLRGPEGGMESGESD
jgi:hypothetical protein